MAGALLGVPPARASVTGDAHAPFARGEAGRHGEAAGAAPDPRPPLAHLVEPEPEVAPEVRARPEPVEVAPEDLAAPPAEEPTSAWPRHALRVFLLAGVPLAVTAYGQQVWDWGKDPWRVGSEGFFGRNTPHGGADKVGHAYGHYVLFRAARAIFDYTEGGRDTRSLVFAGVLASAIGLGIEIGDGYNGGYGFSFEDLIADFAGIGLGLLLETSPKLDELLGFSATYWPSRGFRRDPDKRWLELEGDTGGWTYLLNLRLAGAHHLGWTPPDLLRFLQLDVGYQARGYTRWDDGGGAARRERALFAGVSVNLAEVTQRMFADPRSRLARAAAAPFRYYHVPVGLRTAVAQD